MFVVLLLVVFHHPLVRTMPREYDSPSSPKITLDTDINAAVGQSVCQGEEDEI